MINNKWDIKYLQTQIKLQHLIDTVYTEAAKEAALIGTNITIKDPEKIFTFDDYPATKNRVNTLLNTFAKNINATLVNGINTTWDISNNKNNELCEKVHRNAQTPAQVLQNQNARAAFIQRKQAGLNLSDRVWNYTNQFKNEIELTLDGSIRDGLTAPEAARQLKQYLKHPDKLFRRVRNKHGILKLSKRAAAFNPGQGVYRSSYKNARRLAATEINMAYRTADHIRWQEMDFVVGIKIELSNNHTCLDSKGHPRAFTDICDDLQGNYPKTFKFVGWHPHCRCHATPILKTTEEMNADTRSIIQGNAPIKPTDSKNSVQQLPKVFTEWSKDNNKRILKAKNIPYFIKDNFKINGGKLTPLWVQRKQEILKQAAHNKARTEFTNHDASKWEHTFFNANTGGYVVRHVTRVANGQRNKQEAAKLAKETHMCRVFADNGYKIEMLEEVPRISSPDVLINGVPAELKSLTSYKQIVRRAKHAIEEQGAKMVLFELPLQSIEVEKELDKLRRQGINGFYYYKEEKKVHKL